MIARLQGVIESRGENWVILDVRDIGYIVYCSGRTLARLPALGTTVALHVETHVRAEAITLYGFLDRAERDWFCLLTTVQGVGAKLALHLLSALAPDQLTLAITAQDKAALTSAVGVGPRLAARLLTELRGKHGVHLPVCRVDTGSSTILGREHLAIPLTVAAADAVSALVNLGYDRVDALAVVAQAEVSLAHEVPQSSSSDVGTLLRAALQAYARGNGG